MLTLSCLLLFFFSCTCNEVSKTDQVGLNSQQYFTCTNRFLFALKMRTCVSANGYGDTFVFDGKAYCLTLFGTHAFSDSK